MICTFAGGLVAFKTAQDVKLQTYLWEAAHFAN